jgi:hypothetical protein
MQGTSWIISQRPGARGSVFGKRVAQTDSSGISRDANGANARRQESARIHVMSDRRTDRPRGGSPLASALNGLVGLWLLVSPWLLGKSWLPSATCNALAVGAAVLTLAAIRLKTPEATFLSWINCLLGVWLFLSPFLFGFYVLSLATANAMIFGLAIAFAGLLAGLKPRSDME